MAKFGKKYVEAAKKVDRTKTYSVAEAVKLAKETNIAKFDASVEVSFKLNVDPRHADQQIRGAMVLPHGTGKTQKVCVITQGPKEQEAKDAGADFVGGKELLEDIQKGWFDFDVIVATPNMMGELGKLGRLLGPKGLMPNPKVEYRVDKEGNINLMIGKVSFDDEKLVDNFNALLKVISKARPAAVKGTYIKNLVISTTMGPGVKVTVEK